MSEMFEQSAENSQSLLGAIRKKESAITRELAAARETAARKVNEAEEEAQMIVSEAVEAGRQEGESARKQAMTEIEQEAEAILAQAEVQAESLRNLKEEALEKSVLEIVSLLTGSEL